MVTAPSTGQVLAMASYPTYDPSVFTGGISTEDYKALTDKANGEPLLNRAIGGTYAPQAAGNSSETFPGYGYITASIDVAPATAQGGQATWRWRLRVNATRGMGFQEDPPMWPRSRLPVKTA